MANSLERLRKAKFLILGGNGQLAKEFAEQFIANSIDFKSYDIDDVDISDIDNLKLPIDSYKPDFILNCAAYNLVDLAETELEIARKANTAGPRNVAMLSADYRIKALHFGTDYVFDGTKSNGLYTELDKTNPINNYGITKLEGEKLFAENSENNLIFRLSWVYGKGKQNFIAKVLEWAKNSKELRITSDEVSVPTSCKFIADLSLKALSNDISGLYHCSPQGQVSRYEWAKMILEFAGKKVKISEASIEEFNLPAKRPKFSAMDSGKLAETLGERLESWEEGLSQFQNLDS